MGRQNGHSKTISIHALREEGDVRHGWSRPIPRYFYPRPPRGGRPCRLVHLFPAASISIHALREEGDPTCAYVRASPMSISIHALREEGDAGTTPKNSPYIDFYPRPPRGGRPHRSQKQVGQRCDFYPRPPRGGRLGNTAALSVTTIFLSTPSARRATRHNRKLLENQSDFYPRPPRGGRQQKQRQNLYFQTNYTTFCTNLEEL